jgi:hypothetical protein
MASDPNGTYLRGLPSYLMSSPNAVVGDLLKPVALCGRFPTEAFGNDSY